MSTSLHVRRYEPPDRDAVWTVHDRAFRESPTTFYPWFDRYLRHVPETFLDGDGEFLVGTLPADEEDRGEYDPPGERVVAVGGFLPVEDRSSAASDRVARLRSVRVDPAFQRRRYGRRLVRALERRAAERGFDRVVLETNADLHAAQALYRSLGYVELDRQSPEGRDVELVAFGRPLGDERAR